jgi:hypothetical protein
MAGATALQRFQPRREARIIGAARDENGNPTAAREYKLGCAWDGDALIVRLIEEVPGIGITFEAHSFDHAFERALDIATDMAELAGHMADGVVVSLLECDSLADLGIEVD